MAKEENLKPVQSKEEARERGSAGGKASGETRRRKKTMKQAAKLLMDMAVPEGTARKLKSVGVDEKDTTYQMAVMVAILQDAMRGDVKAATFLRDTLGETEPQQVEAAVKYKTIKFEGEKDLKD